jgi:hypothetical protein
MVESSQSKSFFRCISSRKIIKCSVEDLWSIISSPSNLEIFHPFCKKNNVIIWNGNNSEDELEYLNGRKMIRKFVRWEEGIGYDLFINQIDKPSSFVSWRISRIKDDSQIEITVFPYLFNKKYKILMFIPFYIFIYTLLKSYLNSVVNGLEFYIMNNTPVKKNQFGRHIWFS